MIVFTASLLANEKCIASDVSKADVNVLLPWMDTSMVAKVAAVLAVMMEQVEKEVLRAT